MSATLQHMAAFEATAKGLIRRQRTTPRSLPTNLNLKDQTAIVTGSNVGIGLEASRQLLKLGLSHLIMGVRSQAKGDAAASQLRKDFPDSKVSATILDMESYDSIRQFSERCASLEHIDIVILNAGITVPKYKTCAGTGHEITTQVDYLSTVFLALLLIPVLRTKKSSGSSRPPVLNIVGSDVMYSASTLKMQGPVLPQMDDRKTFGQFSTYANAKFLLAFFVAKLAELVDPKDVLINLSNPGLTKGTGFGHESSLIMRTLFTIPKYFLARTVEAGASVYLNAALAQGAESHGSFISEWEIKP